MCIYQTYYYLYFDSSMKIEKNKKTIKNCLGNEPKFVQEYVRQGLLSKFLVHKAKEHEDCFYVRFFDDELVLKGVKIDEKGDIHEIIDNTEFNGKKVFLYDKKHVAPSKDVVYSKIETAEKKEREYRLVPINQSTDKHLDPIIMAFDMETFCDDKFNAIPYCISLYSNDIKKVFYGTNCVIDFVDFLYNFVVETDLTKTHAKGKIQQYFIYGFNNSRFDNLLLYKELKKLNVSTKFMIVDNTIKYMRFFNIKFFDLSLYYVGSLASTAKAFQLPIVKGVYPYKFDTCDNIYYQGLVPDVKYWKSESDMNEYIAKNGTSFDKREYCSKYCLLDSQLTFQIASKHAEMCKGEINGRYYNVLEKPTGAGIALGMFSSVFLNETIRQSPVDQQKAERLAYKGGRTEVFKKFGTDLLYYDINSSYPYAMTQDMPYKFIRKEKFAIEREYHKFIDTDLYYARSEYIGSNPHFIPNLLTRSDKSDIIATANSDYGYHWGVELNEALANQCHIFVSEHSVYSYRKVFDQYAEHFYDERLKIKKSNPVKGNFYKLLLNSLYGKFAQSSKEKIAFCAEPYEIDRIIGNPNNKVTDFYQIDDNVVIKYIDKNDESESVGNLIRFSSYIAGLARTNLSKMMRNVGHENIYYCDTDSVFSSKQPDPEFLNESILGKWKLEDNVKNAIFLAPKSYMYNTDSELVMKAKGMKGSELKESYYSAVANGQDQVVENDSMFFRSLDGVKIKPQSRTLSVTYNKRIWDKNGNSMPFVSYNDWYAEKYDMILEF